MKIHVKHMVSRRCKIIVAYELEKLGLKYTNIDLGVIKIAENVTKTQKQLLKEGLSKTGLEVIEDKTEILIEQIKTAIIEFIHYSDDKLNVPFSTYLSNKLNRSYTYLSNLFTKSEGYTITHFIITHRIERVKELISYGELTFSEISFLLHYSSIAHLSNQFKKVTGTTLSLYKKQQMKRQMYLETI